MTTTEELKERYIAEALIWSPLDHKIPLFRYVQDPVFNLTSTEVILMEFLHQEGLQFTMRPRYDPSSFICINATLNNERQHVRIEVHHGQPSFCVFILERTDFAEEFKGWLDRHFGISSFLSSIYVMTRRYVHYPYMLNISMDFIAGLQHDKLNLSELHRKNIYEDNRNSTLFFNFSAQEKHFLNCLEDAVEHRGAHALSPLQVLVMPRQTEVGSIELVLQNENTRQPARIFISGFQPLVYQVISENSPLTMSLKECLDMAFGEQNFDKVSSRFASKYASLIYNVRYPMEHFERLQAARPGQPNRDSMPKYGEMLKSYSYEAQSNRL